MINNKYKILVLSDLKESIDLELKSTLSLAKMVDGEITLFHVKKPTDVVERESQLSAIRTINKEHILVDNKIKKILKDFSNEYNISINHSFSIGNVKNEIEKCIGECKPDIIVLGKRKSKALSFIGDNITEFVLDKYNGAVMVVADKSTLEPNKDVFLGGLNESVDAFDTTFTKELIGYTNKPIKAFKILEKTNANNETVSSKKENTLEYVFEKGDNSIKNLSKYLVKNNINLLCLNRFKNTNKGRSVMANSEIKNIINTVNISLLISNNPNSTVNKF